PSIVHYLCNKPHETYFGSFQPTRVYNEMLWMYTEILCRYERLDACPKCHAFTDLDTCSTCTSRAGAKSLCVVEKSSDIMPFERSGVFKGLYFVLGGVISPLDGIGPESLHLPQLVARIKDEGIEELVLALGSSPEADSTSLMIDRMLAGTNVKRTRLARGIPMGSDLEFVDEVTMLRAFEGRVSL
ncbi:MAG: recombination protein RecR, partial [Fibrobacter sp.]|nr:recombination protein RecR [Fibrobacter sp.]